jgi:hypothetical protein
MRGNSKLTSRGSIDSQLVELSWLLDLGESERLSEVSGRLGKECRSGCAKWDEVP